MGRRREPTFDSDEVDRRAHLCHCIGIMARHPVARTNQSGFRILDEHTNRHGDDARLVAVRERSLELAFRRDRPNARSNVKGALTEAELDELVAMIPEEWRESIVRNARSLMERGERFERKYGRGSRSR
jgi:hypothetical protein